MVLRKRLKDCQPVGDRLLQPRAAAVDRRPVQRRIAVEAVLALARQHRPEGRRNRYPTLLVEPVRISGDKTVHHPPNPVRAITPPRAGKPDLGPPPRARDRPSDRRNPAAGQTSTGVSTTGMIWDIMGIDGRSMERHGTTACSDARDANTRRGTGPCRQQGKRKVSSAMPEVGTAALSLSASMRLDRKLTRRPPATN